MLGDLARRLGYLFRRNQFAEELDVEVRFHLEARAEGLKCRGMNRGDAWAQARREFGNWTIMQESSKESAVSGSSLRTPNADSETEVLAHQPYRSADIHRDLVDLFNNWGNCLLDTRPSSDLDGPVERASAALNEKILRNKCRGAAYCY